jgi:Undecaprenyl-phosphate glucose phosphotransferase
VYYLFLAGKLGMRGFFSELSVDGQSIAEAVLPKSAPSAMPTAWSPFWLSRAAVSVGTGAFDFLLVTATAAAVAAAYSERTGRALASGWIVTAVLAATLFVGGFERIGGYALDRLSQLKWQISRSSLVWSGTVLCLLLLAFAERETGIYSRAWALSWLILAPAALIFRGYFLQLVLEACGRSGCLARNVVIVGAGGEAHRLIVKLQRSNRHTIVIRGVFDDEEPRLPAAICGVRVLGGIDDLLRLARVLPIDEVIVALPLNAERKLRELCDKMKALAIDVRLSIEPLAEIFEVCAAGYVGDVPILSVIDKPLKGWRAVLKGAEDKILALLLLLVAGPLMLVLAVLIKLDSRGPVLFVQNRFGFNNQVIRVLKFRTMRVDRGDASGAARTVRDDPRVTRFGRILRRYSLDELPQLINVLRGEMSLVGPRPHAVKMRAGERLYADAVEHYPHRHRVRPGITGWAQVNGLRGEVDTLEKGRARVAHDLYYIAHWSLWLDLKILVRTAGIVLSGAGAW